MMTGTLIAWNMVMNNKMFSDVVPSVTWLTSLRFLNERKNGSCKSCPPMLPHSIFAIGNPTDEHYEHYEH